MNLFTQLSLFKKKNSIYVKNIVISLPHYYTLKHYVGVLDKNVNIQMAGVT
jgi:hypothetical protein